MRPIQWHLKHHCHIPEALEKIIPIPQSLHPHLDWWLDKNNVLRGQPLHPLQHTLQLFTDASNEGWGAHLEDSTAKDVWSAIEKLPPHQLFRAKGSPSGPKEFRASVQGPDCCCCHRQHNGGFLHKQGGMKSGSLCALLWRLLSWCHPRGIILRARHIPGCLNVIVDKLSRHNDSNRVVPIRCSIFCVPDGSDHK